MALATLLLPGCPGANPQAGRVGTDTCLVCHDGRIVEDKHEFLDGPHGAFDCEDCHGPGFDHVRAGGLNGVFIDNPGRDPFGALPELCEKCHAEEVDGFRKTAHFESGRVSCISCHDVHKLGGMRFSTPNGTPLDSLGFEKTCGQCHASEISEFKASGHAQLDVLTCSACHNVHTETTFTAPPQDNRLCQQCHGSYFLGLDSNATIQAHVGDFHPLDPEGTGSSRCVLCHMPPNSNGNSAHVRHDHSLRTIAPSATNDLISAGQPARPNSCAGTTGCHDAAIPGSGEPYDLRNTADNDILQGIYESIGDVPERSR